MSRLLMSAIAMLALATPAVAQEAGQALLINDVRVFDGERIIGARDVLVRDGLIVQVADNLTPPDGAVVLDGAGKTLLPGLMDSHVHVFPTAAADALRFGVTTEFDMFGVLTPALAETRRAQRTGHGRVTEADVWAAGRGVTLPGAHPTGVARGMGWEMPTLDATGDVAAFVHAEVEEGSDYIKIFQDASPVDGAPRFPKYSPERLGEIIAAAHAEGRKAIVHISSEADAADVFALGGDAIAHMYDDRPASPEVVALAKDHGATIIATLSVLAGASGDDASQRLVADPSVGPHLSPVQAGMIGHGFRSHRPEVLSNALESVRRFHAAGVTILAGTDAPNPTTAHGPTLHEELELLVRAGLTPAEALSAATSRPAAFFGTNDRGWIAEGMRADLLLVEGDPTVDITATRDIVGIWKNGYPVDRTVPPMPPMARQ